MLFKTFRCFIPALLATLTMQAQDDALSKKELRKQRPKYFQTGVGINTGNMRDFATSPIVYRGALANVSFGTLKMDAVREVCFSTRFNYGIYGYQRTEGINTQSYSDQYLLFLNYYRLYRIPGLSNSKWNVKIGGVADITTSVRHNPSFRNSGLGYEVFNTFSLSGKATYRLERKRPVTQKFWFLKHTFQPRVALFSFRLNVPVMNNTLRNGFAYIANEGINTPPLFKEYEFKTFSGFRFSSELAYTHQMQNGNMWRVCYLWDAYATGKDYMRFETAHHIFEFSLLFHLNKNTQ